MNHNILVFDGILGLLGLVCVYTHDSTVVVSLCYLSTADSVLYEIVPFLWSQCLLGGCTVALILEVGN